MIDIAKVALCDEAASPAVRQLWLEYRTILQREQEQPGDVPRLVEICAELGIDRAMLEVHSAAVQAVVELEAIIARRDEVHREVLQSHEAIRELDRKFSEVLLRTQNERTELLARNDRAFHAEQAVIHADQVMNATMAYFHDLFGRNPSTVNRAYARRGMSCALRNMLRDIEGGEGGAH